ncbi:sentrin-specific protease 3-like [Amphiura filiformis]|uniref:sentrin-specific protease 3-like n=1 Tax=Amphiura filiformis TaxID=82378 RepID=UPI003B2230C9
MTPPVSSRTRNSIGSGKKAIEEIDDKDVVEDGNKEDDDIWQKDVVLLSIQCKGPIGNRQLASCINGIFLDLQAENPSKLKALTVDELQKKLETIYQQDLSERRSCIEYVYQKLRRDGPKEKKGSPEVVTIGKITLTADDLYTLADHQWLNDNIVNAYMYLITTSCKKKVFAHSTFFYTKLSKPNKGYDSVRRWTDQVDLFAQDLVLIPVHIRNHWTLAAIHVQQHRIEYYNSLGSNNSRVMGNLIQYLRREASTRERHLFTALKWGTGFMKGLPQQKNGSDCGVYVCQYAKRICYGKQVKFTTMESMAFRTEMCKELANQKLKVSSL